MSTTLMRTFRIGSIALLAVALSAGAAEPKAFRLYPGASQYVPPDTPATEQFSHNLRPGTTITAYLTSDPFDKVVAFYTAIGKEYTPDRKPPEQKLPDGKRIKRAFVILDGAPNLLASTQWIRVQRPFFTAAAGKDGKAEYHDVRDITEIVLTDKVPVKEDKPAKR
jgi:hypothetical protein